MRLRIRAKISLHFGASPKEGLEIGYSLYCPLPFDPREYERDFGDEESRESFRRLLSQAAHVRVLFQNAALHDRGAAYAKAGLEVVRCSDILVAVWDGRPERGEGGTAEIVAGALSEGIPVIWVHSEADHGIRILQPESPVKSGTVSEIIQSLERTFLS